MSVSVAERFRSRGDAGAALAKRLMHLAKAETLVVGIPRSGVPVALVVARALGAKFDIISVRKLVPPVSCELAIGAVTADGSRVLNDAIITELAIDPGYLERQTADAIAEAKRREVRWRGGAPPPDVADRTVILVDDGVATGATMVVAARALKTGKPARLVVAVPVGSAEAWARLRSEVDEVICLRTPEPFWSIGTYYSDFRTVEEDDVDQMLQTTDGRIDQVLRDAEIGSSVAAPDDNTGATSERNASISRAV